MKFIIGRKYKITFEMNGDFNKKTQVVRTYSIKEVNKGEIVLEDRWTPIKIDSILKAELVEEGDKNVV